MIKRDFHIHTTWSDGKHSPEEMVEYALKLGMTHMGFSDHSYTAFDDSYCLSLDRIADYKNEILRLREKYRGRIEIYLGVEQDYYSETSTDGYDYVIGSVHYVKAGKEYLPVDKSAADLRDAVDKYFGKDPVAFCESYFANVSDIVKKTGCDIIGHFDLCTKFNEKDPFIDENDPRYIKAWKDAVDMLIPSGKYFEINTGVIPRGYKSCPYPSKPILDYILERGGKVLFSSDSHRLTVAHGFEEWKQKYKL